MKRLLLFLIFIFNVPCFAELNLVLLGAPGSGKGTLGPKLAERYGVPHISSGDLVREEIKNGTALGLQAKEIMAKGGLLPDTPEALGPLVEIIRRKIEANPEGFILEGFPRSEFQAHELDRVMRSLGRRLDAAVRINMENSVIVDRLSNRLTCPNCKRSYNVGKYAPKTPGVCDDCRIELIRREDDKAEVVEKRLGLFDATIADIERFYLKNNQLVHIDGMNLGEHHLGVLFDRLGAKFPRNYLQRKIPNYLNPETGVRMYNLIEMLKDVPFTQYVVDTFFDELERLAPDYIAAPEARALPLFGALMYKARLPAIFMRKAGKIPKGADVLSTEYFSATSASPQIIEMNNDPAYRGKTVVLVDDGISSGGTTAATVELLERAGLKVLRVFSIVQYHYRAPCEEFLAKGLSDKLTTLVDLN